MNYRQTEDNTWVIDLNSAQKQAVEHTEGPLLILAGAGTGKTLVLINRIAHILHKGLATHFQILATTFTNKAASEMRERIFKLYPHYLPWLGTFHSIACKILREHAELVKLSRNFLILDADDQIKLIKTVMSDLNIDSKEFNPKIISTFIQRWKDLALTPDRVTSNHLESAFHRIALRVYKTYQEKLSFIDSVDFGDLLLKNVEIFKNNPAILESYQDTFKYIMVDEYQDTNTVQYLWLRMLTHQTHNICCVGDDDQSIYGWRGAEVGNILRFENDFQGAKIVKLEQNYRSTNHILKAASSLIANNDTRHTKTLWTETKFGERLVIKSCYGDKEEGNFIAREIKFGNTSSGARNKNTVLVRALFQTRVLEESFIKHSIPYRIIGSVKFYERQEIKDVLAYVKLAMKQHDDLSFERIINKPARGIGKSSIQKIKDLAIHNQTSLFHATEQIVGMNVFGNKAKTTLVDFVRLIRKWEAELQTMNHAQVVENIIEESGYNAMLSKERNIEELNRLENLDELIKALADFKDITEFMEHISLISDTDEKKNTADLVNIMTIHAAKGLEFDTVFLPGWEEGLFPNSRTIDEIGQKGLEEERRLAYVGITRARYKVFISHALTRIMYGQWIASLPSRFLQEIPEECCIFEKH